MMKSILLSLIALFILVVPTSDVDALDRIFRDDSGTSHFNCVNACGPVRVKKTGKCEYLVHSIYFSGKVKACYSEKAGLMACGEIELEPIAPLREGLINTACQ